jgi:phosphocarrier protein
MESAERRTVVISDKDPMGLHLRPAQLLSQLAARYQSEIEVVRDTLRVDAKSILHVMTLAASPGVELVIEARGPDAAEAVERIGRFLENGFIDEDTPGQQANQSPGA